MNWQLRELGGVVCKTPAKDGPYRVLDMPPFLAGLLRGAVDNAGAAEQAARLHRDQAAHVSLDDPAAVARLLGRLREAGAAKQAAAPTDRLPGAAYSSSAASKRATRIGSGLAARLMAAQLGVGGWEDLD